MVKNMIQNARFLTVRQISEINPAFSEASLRWLIFHRQKNGFSACVRKIGRKVVIDAIEFEKFVERGGV